MSVTTWLKVIGLVLKSFKMVLECLSRANSQSHKNILVVWNIFWTGGSKRRLAGVNIIEKEARNSKQMFMPKCSKPIPFAKEISLLCKATFYIGFSQLQSAMLKSLKNSILILLILQFLILQN